MSEFTIRHGSWASLREPAFRVRKEVFVDEQQVPIELEQDELDAVSIHVVAADSNGTPVGTGRLLPDGHIGRMAVRKPWRGSGIGGQLLRRLIQIAVERGDAEVALNAQLTAVPFYLKFGFSPSGGEFVEAGIVHQAMRQRLR